MREDSMKYGYLVVFIGHDSAEILGVSVWNRTLPRHSKNYSPLRIFFL